MLRLVERTDSHGPLQFSSICGLLFTFGWFIIFQFHMITVTQPKIILIPKYLYQVAGFL
ncbi:hypothetical protein BJX66DRAFT_316885 [Aspergillus keveii]|uniref:Uncharacterized protein n=1 Tax=Aspergillus keveii TaxID=714993 RepID=A0ABR4FLZ3_9EURO